MQEANIDFHIHSKYSGGCSRDMDIPSLAKGCEGKGLDVIGTGDATNPNWIAHIKETLVPDNDSGVYSYGDSPTRFLITAEVEDDRRVHHLLLFPELSSAIDFRERIKKDSKDIDTEGRPHLRLSGEQIAELANECGALIGPCHAFTPWTSVYKAHDSLKDCYGEALKHISFLELGLSADCDMADTITELKDLTFLSNSDAHSPHPHRIGREFNRLKIDDLSFDEIKKAILREGGRKIILNVGLDPREGKYHETACTRCYLKFHPKDAQQMKRRCPECGGIIKKGVVERVFELSGGNETKHPSYRPPYIKTVPLAECLGMAIGVKTLTSLKVQSAWNELTQKLGNESEILLNVPLTKISESNKKLAEIIEEFRTGKIKYISGGGGMYGHPVFGREANDNYYDVSQKTLSSF